MKRMKSILTAALVLGFIVLFSALFIILPDKDESTDERRLLAKFPALSFSSVSDGSFMSGFEKYALDQFPLRDKFRSLKAFAVTKIFAQKDNNGLFTVGNHIAKLDYPTDTDSVDYAAKRFSAVYDLYLKENGIKTYLSVIPDKNYFLASQNGYPDKDFNALAERLASGFSAAQNIDISNLLSADSYYLTDPHWRQDKITGVAAFLAEKMGVSLTEDYETRDAGIAFYGAYYGQAALKHSPEKLLYLENAAIKNLTVYDTESGTEIPVYDLDAAAGRDPYEMFLGGSKSVIKITNGNNPDGKKLILFRDSFGSSLAPLLASGYSEITLVDIRYVSPSLLGRLVDFADADDALFIYSASVINNSETIK